MNLRASIIKLVCGVRPMPASDIGNGVTDIKKRLRDASHAVANEVMNVQGGARRHQRRSRALRVQADALRELAEGARR